MAFHTRPRACCFAIATAILLFYLPAARADVPATQPSSPSEVFKLFVQDIRQGKPADLAPLCQAQDADAISLLADFQKIATAIDRLRAAVSKKYGPSFADSVLPPMPTQDDLDDMTQVITADHARLHSSAVGDMPMVNSSGQWKFDLDTMRHSPDFPANPKYFAELAVAVSRTADDITAGKLGTPESANEALDARQKAIADEPPAATQP